VDKKRGLPCRLSSAVSSYRRMDRNPQLKALGNAIVPACAEEIMRAIKSSPLL
jgi:site-specific DNA-cytosine methylase